jgi:hypothetical protein
VQLQFKVFLTDDLSNGIPICTPDPGCNGLVSPSITTQCPCTYLIERVAVACPFLPFEETMICARYFPLTQLQPFGFTWIWYAPVPTLLNAVMLLLNPHTCPGIEKWLIIVKLF